jgi:plasmid stability protein
MKRFVMNIPDELHRRLKIACTLQGKTMTQVALQLLTEFVEKEEKRKFIVYPKS